ncbi:MAG: hypothetical protein OWQ57_11060 [Sulfobacillus sp.]|nr:hypothetical protein [Sulfobacillus sp.]
MAHLVVMTTDAPENWADAGEFVVHFIRAALAEGHRVDLLSAGDAVQSLRLSSPWSDLAVSRPDGLFRWHACGHACHTSGISASDLPPTAVLSSTTQFGQLMRQADCTVILEPGRMASWTTASGS